MLPEVNVPCPVGDLVDRWREQGLSIGDGVRAALPVLQVDVVIAPLTSDLWTRLQARRVLKPMLLQAALKTHSEERIRFTAYLHHQQRVAHRQA